MNYEQFRNLLDGRKGASFITITALTEPDWKPKKETGPNPYKGLIKKRSRVNGVINWQYETAVNKQRVREGLTPDFESRPRAWGSRIHGTPWVIYQDKLYLEMKCERVLSVEYINEIGVLVPEAVKYVKTPKHNPRQGVENEIILRDFTVTNILNFTWGGITEVLAA